MTPSQLRSTHTVVQLNLSKAAFDEIASKLRDAEYHHCFMEDGCIDMSGIAVAYRPAARPTPPSVPFNEFAGTRFERIQDIISVQLGVPKHEITPSTRIEEDLGADSLDAVELIMAFEDEYSIEIPDEEIFNVKTCGDIADVPSLRMYLK